MYVSWRYLDTHMPLFLERFMPLGHLERFLREGFEQPPLELRR